MRTLLVLRKLHPKPLVALVGISLNVKLEKCIITLNFTEIPVQVIVAE